MREIILALYSTVTVLSYFLDSHHWRINLSDKFFVFNHKEVAISRVHTIKVLIIVNTCVPHVFYREKIFPTAKHSPLFINKKFQFLVQDQNLRKREVPAKTFEAVAHC